jgi:UDP-glucose 4-epimerase
MAQKVVAITGSSGHLGAKLLEHLEEIQGLGKLVAFDLKPLRAPVHNIAAFRNDVTKPINEELAGNRVDTLVHLAFEWQSGLRRRDATATSERNEAMVRQVIESSIDAGVQHLIYVSTHAVYGARADAPIPVSEEWPRNPAPGFPYAQDNYSAEQVLLELAEQFPEIRVTIFRSCPALGAMTSVALLREMYFPGWLGLSDHNPALQFVSDDDLARIICMAITRELKGVFNVAGTGVVFLRELANSLASRRIQLPASIVYPLKRLTGGAFVANSHYLDRWPVIMSTGRLQQATGYRYRRMALDAVSCLISYNEEFEANPPKLSAVR